MNGSINNRWGNLSLKEKNTLLGIYASKGYTDLASIIAHYNSFADGGRLTLQQWKSKMQSKYPDIEMDNDKAGYDYDSYFNDNYDAAVRQLSDLQHFPDTYKLPNHRTFSNESMYSRGPMIGGQWTNAPISNKSPFTTERFTPSNVNRQYYSDIYKENRPYSEGEIYHSFSPGGNLGHITWGGPVGIDSSLAGSAATASKPMQEIVRNYNEEMARSRGNSYTGNKGDEVRRKRLNDTPTAQQSQDLEDAMHKAVYNSVEYNSPKYDYTIPYIYDKEIKINGHRTSENVLDTLYKYSQETGLPFVDALGLAGQETGYGSMPVLNIIPENLGLDLDTGLTAKEENRILANTNYFRNYGSIPANNLVRDFAWENTDMSQHPLIHAFNYFKAGKYNTGDPNHTSDVRRTGQKALESKAVREWAKRKGITFDNGGHLFAPGGNLDESDEPTYAVNGQIDKKPEDLSFVSELDWSPESWFSKRVAKPDGTYYNADEAARLASHVPEYYNIEKTSKQNGTWLKMDDGSTWEGDPRAWVMMQSQAYRRNYSPKPWYTGQAEWPTKFDYPKDKKGAIKTNKVTRAPYYNGQMWFSNDKTYGDAFSYYYASTGEGMRQSIPEEANVLGHTFLSAIPKNGIYRKLAAPKPGTADRWDSMPYFLQNGHIYREKPSNISTTQDFKYVHNTRKDGKKVLTDDVVNWSRDLGDQGIFLHQVDDGRGIKFSGDVIDILKRYSEGRNAKKRVKKSEFQFTYPILEEFISHPGFTDKVKFIEGNTGDFDINNPYKYAENVFDNDSSQDTVHHAALGGHLHYNGSYLDEPDNPPVKTYNIPALQPIISVADNTQYKVSPTSQEIEESKKAYEAAQIREALAKRTTPVLKADTRTKAEIDMIAKQRQQAEHNRIINEGVGNMMSIGRPNTESSQAFVKAAPYVVEAAKNYVRNFDPTTEIRNAMYFVPGISNVMMAQDARTAFDNGQTGAGVINAAFALAPMLGVTPNFNSPLRYTRPANRVGDWTILDYGRNTTTTPIQSSTTPMFSMPNTLRLSSVERPSLSTRPTQGRIGTTNRLQLPEMTESFRALEEAAYQQHLEDLYNNAGGLNADELFEEFEALRARELVGPNPEPEKLGNLIPSTLNIRPQIKPLIKGAEIEKQLSKTGTISRKSLDAYIAKQGKYYQDVMNETLESEFKGVDKIDYVAFQDAVQKRLPEYSRISQTLYQDYGFDNLGFRTRNGDSLTEAEILQHAHNDELKALKQIDEDFDRGNINSNTRLLLRKRIRDSIAQRLSIKLNTFTFETPGIAGNTLHYRGNPIGHSRTYTTTTEPEILHVMESQSDWAQHSTEAHNIKKLKQREARQRASIEELETALKDNKFPNGMTIEYDYQRDMINEDIARYKQDLDETLRYLDQAKRPTLYKQMIDTYTERQIQENLRYAAEQGQTKMRYPTRETAAKIEGYSGTPYGEYYDVKKELDEVNGTLYGMTHLPEPPRDITGRNTGEELSEATRVRQRIAEIMESDMYKQTAKKAAELRKKLREVQDKKYIKYSPQHETILKKYDAFPKQFQKLFGKKAEVRTVTDGKGNTWYEVDVPESYVNKTGQIIFSTGGLLGLSTLNQN